MGKKPQKRSRDSDDDLDDLDDDLDDLDDPIRSPSKTVASSSMSSSSSSSSHLQAAAAAAAAQSQSRSQHVFPPIPKSQQTTHHVLTPRTALRYKNANKKYEEQWQISPDSAPGTPFNANGSVVLFSDPNSFSSSVHNAAKAHDQPYLRQHHQYQRNHLLSTDEQHDSIQVSHHEDGEECADHHNETKPSNNGLSFSSSSSSSLSSSGHKGKPNLKVMVPEHVSKQLPVPVSVPYPGSSSGLRSSASNGHMVSPSVSSSSSSSSSATTSSSSSAANAANGGGADYSNSPRRNVSGSLPFPSPGQMDILPSPSTFYTSDPMFPLASENLQVIFPPQHHYVMPAAAWGAWSSPRSQVSPKVTGELPPYDLSQVSSYYSTPLTHVHPHHHHSLHVHPHSHPHSLTATEPPSPPSKKRKT